MKLTLNDNQKKFLLKEYYVDAQALDACRERGWEDYFIKYFNWVLELELNCWNMRLIQFIDIETNEIIIEYNLNFQNDDFDKLLKIK